MARLSPYLTVRLSSGAAGAEFHHPCLSWGAGGPGAAGAGSAGWLWLGGRAADGAGRYESASAPGPAEEGREGGDPTPSGAGSNGGAETAGETVSPSAGHEGT